MSDDPDFEYLIVDSTIVRAHQHAAGAKKARPVARRPEHEDPYGCSRPGMSGAVTLTAGQKGDASQAVELIEGLPAEVVMADTAYDADPPRQAIAAKWAIAVVPNNPSRALKYPLDRHLYAQRHPLAIRQLMERTDHLTLVGFAALYQERGLNHRRLSPLDSRLADSAFKTG